jgi:hypothetical protein
VDLRRSALRWSALRWSALRWSALRWSAAALRYPWPAETWWFSRCEDGCLRARLDVDSTNTDPEPTPRAEEPTVVPSTAFLEYEVTVRQRAVRESVTRRRNAHAATVPYRRHRRGVLSP